MDRAGGSRHQTPRDFRIFLEQICRLQPSRNGCQCADKRIDGPAIGRFLHDEDCVHNRRECRLTHRYGGCGPFLHERQHGLHPTARFANRPGSFKLGVNPFATESSERLGHAVFEDGLRLRKAGVETGQ
ncbi:MAG: hypothetical protein B7X35_01015 [Halothiobacillus sp. 14-56-357]|uniref:hypothetical protein n=1 Tax=Halothiobacillus sp. 15-55-196 TaxID=1970382 RepID=UPI000BDA0687|nr:hypothetical protein [Halothiobacillus sp. 15-55-196]OZB35675.1 MAG: hypothetical protein B7X44_08985 [Halothiobacillus sp. 15-55-196]OZB57460.1 MAG: hypothetical protein B7X35_01015 [Halothiobacillus sp. 14-56-357]OZB79395.1 MAG: hypothetical protein B7X29_01060 [Halothiobacillus sp. 13-55-115]